MTRRLVDQDRIREQRRQNRILLLLERKYARVFAAEIARASRSLLDHYKVMGVVPEIDPAHQRKIEAVFSLMATDAIEAFGERIVDQGKAMQIVPEKKDFSAAFARLALEFITAEAIRRKITSISETTRNQIIAIVEGGQKRGEGIDKIAKTISGSIRNMSFLRGAIIARTETHSAANFGADNAARMTGLPLIKEWVATNDERTRDSHRSADGQTREMDQPFDINGYAMMYAGDMNAPASEVINCRCSISHIVQGY